MTRTVVLSVVSIALMGAGIELHLAVMYLAGAFGVGLAITRLSDDGT